MDRIGLTGAGNEITSVKAKGPYTVVITLKAPDSQFIAATLNRSSSSRSTSGRRSPTPATFTNPNPVGSGPFNVDHPLHDAGLRLREEPALLAERARRRSRASSTCRRRRTTRRSR